MSSHYERDYEAHLTGVAQNTELVSVFARSPRREVLKAAVRIEGDVMQVFLEAGAPADAEALFLATFGALTRDWPRKKPTTVTFIKKP